MAKDAEVTLAPIADEDSRTLFEWINDRELVLFNAPYRPVGPTHHRKWFESIQEREDVVIFAIRDKGGRLVGTCQLLNRNPVHRSAELQIRIGDPGDRGRGYGTAAVQQLLRFAFADWNLHRVQLYVLEGNAAALRAYEKCGFQKEGVLRDAVHIDGAYRNLIVMGVLRDEVKPPSV
jgi:RimJ/RimL family protein N-acetyltransferase